MPRSPPGSPARIGCSACPGSENATPGSHKCQPSYAYASGSASVGRTLGRRSLEAFSSLRGSFKGRRALQTTTNQKTAAPATSLSVGYSSPVGPPTKQKWYESLRGKSSHIPTPSSPTSMSSTLKRSRFFRSSPVQPRVRLPSPCAALQTMSVRDRLPMLELDSFQSELQRMSMFGEPTVDTGKTSAQKLPALLPRP